MLKFAHKKYFIFDLDGTVYQGSKLFPWTLNFLEKLRSFGKFPIFLTNNSSKSLDEYSAKLKKLGLAKSASEIYTSGIATIEYLQNKFSKKNVRIFLMANSSVEKEFKKAGFVLTDKNPEAVVLAFDQNFSYEKFCKAYNFLIKGIPYFATHPDLLLPIENNQFQPDIGALIAYFYSATKRLPTVIGKPNKTIFSQLQKHLNCKKSEMVMIGDRLYTDIKGANDFDIDSVLVLSGETKKDHLKKSKIKPSLVLENISKIEF